MCEGVAHDSHSGIPAAGASQHAAVEEVSTKVADEMFQLNVLGPIALTRAALPFLLSRRKGRLVVVSSMAAAVPAPGQAVYSGTKLALHGYFATLQSELNDRQALFAIAHAKRVGKFIEPLPSISCPIDIKSKAVT